MTAPRSKRCLSICSSRRTVAPQSRSSLTSTRPTIRCTAIKRVGFSTAFTTASAICRSTFSAAATCSPPSCGSRISMPRPAPSRRSHALSPRSASAGHGCGFCSGRIPASHALMAWCEANRVDFLFGLARNERLVQEIKTALVDAAVERVATGRAARRFRDFSWCTLDSWSRDRRVIGKAEWTGGEANPRFVVTSLKPAEADAQYLYETIYCARGEMENRIKECQLDLFADRTSAATMRANQLRLWFASMAYVLLCALRRIGLAHTQFARATCGTIRLKLLKIGALVRISVRRIKIAMASACPWQHEFGLAHALLANAAR